MASDKNYKAWLMEAAQDVANYMHKKSMAFRSEQMPPGAVVYLQQSWKPPPQGREVSMIWARARKILLAADAPTQRFVPGKKLPKLPPPAAPTSPMPPPREVPVITPTPGKATRLEQFVPESVSLSSEPEKRPNKRGTADYKRWLDEAASDAIRALGSMTISQPVIAHYLKRRWKPRPKPAEVQAITRRLQAQMIVAALRGVDVELQRAYVRAITSKRLKTLVRKMLKEAPAAPLASEGGLTQNTRRRSNVKRGGLGRRRYGAPWTMESEEFGGQKGDWHQWRWGFIYSYTEQWGHQPREDGYRSRDYYSLFEEGLTPDQAASKLGGQHQRNPQYVSRTSENPQANYFVHIPSSRANGLKSQDYGPYTLEQAKRFARIGSQKGRSRVIFRGSGKRAKKIRRYTKGQRVFPKTRAQVRGFLPEEKPREV